MDECAPCSEMPHIQHAYNERDTLTFDLQTPLIPRFARNGLVFKTVNNNKNKTEKKIGKIVEIVWLKEHRR